MTVSETRAVGAEGTHLQLTLKEGAVSWRAISFGNAEHMVPAGERADIVYTFKRDDFRGGGARVYGRDPEAGVLLGVLAGIHANAYIVDAIIGLSVVYKAFENIGGFKRLGISIDMRAAVLLFGFAHGFGLSTKLQDLSLSAQGLVPNMIAFNIGVELGQLAALTVILIAFTAWRRSGTFIRGAYAANVLIMAAGFALFGYQLTGYLAA